MHNKQITLFTIDPYYGGLYSVPASPLTPTPLTHPPVCTSKTSSPKTHGKGAFHTAQALLSFLDAPKCSASSEFQALVPVRSALFSPAPRRADAVLIYKFLFAIGARIQAGAVAPAA